MKGSYELNVQISKNIKNLMDLKKINFYDIAKKTNKKRSTYNDKLTRLAQGKGISTNSLYEFAEILEVPVYFLIK